MTLLIFSKDIHNALVTAACAVHSSTYRQRLHYSDSLRIQLNKKTYSDSLAVYTGKKYLD